MALAETQGYYDTFIRLLASIGISATQKKVGQAQANYVLSLAKNAEGRNPAVAMAASLEMNKLLSKVQAAASLASTGAGGSGLKGTEMMAPSSNRAKSVTVEDAEDKDDFSGNRAFDGGLGFSPAGLVQTLTGSAPADLLLQAVGPVTIRSQLTPEITYAPGQNGGPPTEQSSGGPGEILLQLLKPEIEWKSPLGVTSMAPYGKPTANYFPEVAGVFVVVTGVLAWLAYRGLRDVTRRAPARRSNPRRRRLARSY